ncbi:hypothetical protein PPYR_03304 [Photinus pyralis]|uniref:Uncharacterized protein n=1 Tax=Photinus pyralis TaxID=7054 RepID=A0A5N4A2E8_PHOPY|nr:uncharacterized protein LOC116161060 [Photinus pyralis]KAB0791504.1 hypothetical protein PPYR_03304 [Photinus pyralis]
MAPSPENDNAPKAPDKGDKTKTATADTNLEITSSAAVNKEASVSGLDDVGLKALLDEAISYKTPKDRVGKSELFQNLLEKAEEDDRKARATSASGKESVRYYNTTAKHRTRRRRQPTSVSENLTHGGSLNNLAEENLYAPTSHLHRLTKNVSTRQRQGGSLPCNVNAGVTSFYDKQFFEEMARKKTEDKKAEYTAIEMESESLLEHDSLNQEYNEPETDVRIPRVTTKYTSRFNLDICGGSANVDDSLTVSALERTTDKILEKEIAYAKPLETISATNCIPEYLLPSLHSRNIFPIPKYVEDKKVDENGNAVGQGDSKKNKKKKIQPADKNVVVLEGKDVVGHRSDIAHDVDKIMEFLGEQESKKASDHKSKTSNAKKQRIRSKGKTEKMQKSNSLEEICVSKLDDFNFKECDAGKVPLRGTKSNIERPRERRSWGNSESLPFHASAENLESADFRVVTKKKKSKKVRNSMSSRRQHYAMNLRDDPNRASSPEPRRKSACSVPQSDKSNDSSDVDSVHSLPIDTEHMNIVDSANLNLPISYAEIAKHTNSLERPKWKGEPTVPRDRSPINVPSEDWQSKVVVEKKINKISSTNNVKNIKNNVQSRTLNKVDGEICANVPVLLHNIPDVQTIEKMHFKQLQKTYGLNYSDLIANHYVVPALSNKCEQSQVQYTSNPCDSDRTNSRPAVVILSDNGKEVSDLTFGFEVNEQLLSDDVCEYFTTRFHVPEVFHKHNHDKIVNFIGLSWEDALNQTNGKVKYFSDQL